MLVTLIRKELLLSAKSARYLLVTGLLLVTMVTATAVRATIFIQLTADYEQSRREWNELVAFPLEQASFLQRGTWTAKAPNVLSVFAEGTENEQSRSYRARFQNYQGELPPVSGLRRLSGIGFRQGFVPDAVSIIALIGGLFALLLVYDSINGEREQGTLRLILSGPVSRDQLIVSKIVAGLVTLALPLIISWAASILWLIGPMGISLTTDQLARVWTIAAMSVLYVSVFLTLGVAASVWTSRSVSALSVCVLCWIACALIVPNTIPVVVRYLVPVPPAARIELQRAAMFEDIGTRQRAEMLARAMRESGRRGWSNVYYDGGVEAQEREREIRVVEKLEHDYHTRLKQHTGLAQALSQVSPVTAFTHSALSMAGTGVDDFHAYVAALDRFRKDAAQARIAIHEDAKARAKAQNTGVWGVAYDHTPWPTLSIKTAGFGDALKRGLIGIGYLAGLAVLFILLSIMRFLRFDVR